MRHALITGGAGFIGSHLADLLLQEGGWQVTVLDNFEPNYDRAVKERNIRHHAGHPHFQVIEADIRECDALRSRLTGAYDVIAHLAAKVGVRPSIHDPSGYRETNVLGTRHLLKIAQEREVRQVVFASSSSVYGANPRLPWSEDDPALHPINPYASTKVSGEMLGQEYSRQHGMRFIALRLFTVFGPRQRPDLAMHIFARRILRGEPAPIYGDGSSTRDYTYVGDIVRGIRAAMDYTASPYEVINLGHNRRVSLREMVETLEEALGRRADLQFLPEQPGDLPDTRADLDKAARLLNYAPATDFRDGVEHFVRWLRDC